MNAPNRNTTPEALIIWDVIEEHFDEAAFLIATWQDALIAPNYTLDEVADRVEERLEANLEGLEIGGKAVAEKLLYPALTQAPDSGYAAAAGLVLLRSGDARDREVVLDAVIATDGEQREGLALALAISEVSAIDHELTQRFSSTRDEAACAVWLSLLNMRRVHPGKHLKFCLGSENDMLLAEGMRSLGIHYTPSYGDRYAHFIQKYLNADSIEVQTAAVELGLLIGMPEAWEKCIAAANTSTSNRGQYLEWVALLASRGEFQLLFPLLDDPEMQETALWCLGLTGSITSVERAIGFLDNDDSRLAKLAFEAISHITGLDMEENEFQQDEAVEDEEEIITGLDDEPPVSDPVEHLVLPNRDTIKAWWEHTKGRFSLDQRYVLGEPLDVNAFIKTLETGPARIRNPLAHALWIRTHGQRFVSTETFSNQQYDSLNRLASLQPGELSNYF